MRTRIAQGAARALAAPLRNITDNASDRPRRAAASVLLSAVVLAGVVFGPMMAGANHRFVTRHRERAHTELVAPRHALAAAYGRMPIGLRWLAAWQAAHPRPARLLDDASSTTTSDWACIRLYESGDRYNSSTAPGGAYGFLESTWLSLGYSGWPYQASPAVQSEAALYLYNELGWQPWSTRFVCGL